MTLGMKALELARQSVGVHEDTDNWGVWIRVYLAFVGIRTPAPWCAAFVTFKVHQAAKALGVKATMPKTGYCPTIWNWAVKNHHTLAVPQPGCLFLVWNDSLHRYAHVGFVAEVHGSYFTSVEGNSNNTGSREGKGVCSNTRRWSLGDAKFAFAKFAFAEVD